MSIPSSRSIGELMDFVRRHKAALAEAGHPEWAEHAHVCIDDLGNTWVSYRPRSKSQPMPAMLKALDIDPVFQHGGEGR